MPPSDFKDPYRQFDFYVEIHGVIKGGFTECSAFSSSTDPIEYREGGKNTFIRKIPGQTKHANIVLKKGLTDSTFLSDWYLQVTQGTIVRHEGCIIVLDPEGNEQSRWEFTRAWPTKYTGPDLNAKGTEIAIETFELAHEGLVRKK